MKRFFIFWLTALFFFVIPEMIFAKMPEMILRKRGDEQYVSMISLIANPQVYSGKYVVVQGYFVATDDEDLKIYFDENSYVNDIPANSIELKFSTDPQKKIDWTPMNKHYVTVTGLFHKEVTLFGDGVIEEVYMMFPPVRKDK